MTAKQMSSKRRKDGVEIRGRKEMVDVFADFYEDLFKSQCLGESFADKEGTAEEEEVPEVTTKERRNN